MKIMDGTWIKGMKGRWVHYWMKLCG